MIAGCSYDFYPLNWYLRYKNFTMTVFHWAGEPYHFKAHKFHSMSIGVVGWFCHYEWYFVSVIVVPTTIFMYLWCSSHNVIHWSLTPDPVRWSDLIRFFFVNSSDLIFCYIISVLQFLYRSFLIGILHSMQWLYWPSHLISYFLSTVANIWP